MNNIPKLPARTSRALVSKYYDNPDFQAAGGGINFEFLKREYLTKGEAFFLGIKGIGRKGMWDLEEIFNHLDKISSESPDSSDGEMYTWEDIVKTIETSSIESVKVFHIKKLLDSWDSDLEIRKEDGGWRYYFAGVRWEGIYASRNLAELSAFFNWAEIKGMEKIKETLNF